MSNDLNEDKTSTSLPANASLPSNAYVEQYMVWENGVPIKKKRLAFAKEDIQEMKLHAATQTYHGDWDPVAQAYIPDARYEGMSKIEVAQHKLMDKAAAGDSNALNQIENRLIGMPKQQVESLNISATLESFLEQVAEKECVLTSEYNGTPDDTSTVIEGEVVGSSLAPESKPTKSNEMDI